MHLTKGLQQKQETFSSRQRLIRINIFEPKSPLSNLTEVGWQGPALLSKAGWERGDTEKGKHNCVTSVFRGNQPGTKSQENQQQKNPTYKPEKPNPALPGYCYNQLKVFLSISLFQSILFHWVPFLLLHLKTRLKFTLLTAKSQKNHTLNMMS